MAMGWTASERLVLLNEEGSYRLYDLQGRYEQYSLGSEVAEVGVLQAQIHEEGIVALVGPEHGSFNGQVGLVEVRGWQGGRPVKFADSGVHFILGKK
jgi:vacuolar protein sorting-associated protein 16